MRFVDRQARGLLDSVVARPSGPDNRSDLPTISRQTQNLWGEIMEIVETIESCAQIDLVCDRFESAWKEGHPLEIEVLLDEVSPVAQRRLLRELIHLELELRASAGERLVLQHWLDRFPEHPDLVYEGFQTTEPWPESLRPEPVSSLRSRILSQLALLFAAAPEDP